MSDEPESLAALMQAYREAEYRVHDRGWTFVLGIDRPSSALVVCHDAFRVDCSAFITAWNPRSQPTTRAHNDAAQARLRNEVELRGLVWLHGIGVDSQGRWEGEESLLVLGLERGAAVSIGRRFEQHAVVWAGADGVPELVRCL